MAGKRPDIDRRYFLVAARQKLAARILQIDYIEQERIVPPAIEIEKRYPAKYFSRTLKDKNRLGILAQEVSEARFRGGDTGDFAAGHGNEIGELPALREFTSIAELGESLSSSCRAAKSPLPRNIFCL